MPAMNSMVLEDAALIRQPTTKIDRIIAGTYHEVENREYGTER